LLQLHHKSDHELPSFHAKNLPIPLDILAGQDLADLSRKALDLKAKKRDTKPDSNKDEPISKEDVRVPPGAPPTTTTITRTTTVRSPSKITTNTKETVLFGPQPAGAPDDETETVPGDAASPENSRPSSPVSSSSTLPVHDGSPFLGLKVYTPKQVSVSIKGQLRHDMKASFEGLTVADWNSFSI